MKVSESKARLLLALVLNGADQGDGVRVPERRCNLCGSFLVRFEASAGLQAAPGVAAVTESCVNTKTRLGAPCLMAIRAKPLLDSLKTATRPA